MLVRGYVIRDYIVKAEKHYLDYVVPDGIDVGVDTDGDELLDYEEIFAYCIDPFKPSPNVGQALDLELGKH